MAGAVDYALTNAQWRALDRLHLGGALDAGHVDAERGETLQALGQLREMGLVEAADRWSLTAEGRRLARDRGRAGEPRGVIGDEARRLGDAREAERWLLEAKSGERAVYHETGDGLYADRLRDPRLDALARYLAEHSTMDQIPVASATAVGPASRTGADTKVRGMVRPSGEVALSSHRSGGKTFFLAEVV